jgi:hypothetical protein
MTRKKKRSNKGLSKLFRAYPRPWSNLLLKTKGRLPNVFFPDYPYDLLGKW